MKLQNKPLCVDCDGTLIATDLLHESFFLLLKQAPLYLFYLPIWLLNGKAYLKQRMAETVEFNFSTLPYRPEVLELIKEAREHNLEVVLATASPKSWANGIALHLGCFDKVVASSYAINLAGKNKAEYLVNLYGEGGFNYIGDSKVDLHVWKRSAGAIVVSSNALLSCKVINLIHSIEYSGSNITSYIRALRIHQWLKNLLIFVPLLAAHQISSTANLVQTIFAYFAFSLCASSVYLLNDLLDLESDRLHIRKCKRPFAAGDIPLWHGAFIIPILLISAFSLSLLVAKEFTFVLISYFLMTMAYSFRLKKQVIVDVVMLAGLYTLRIIAGASATNIKPSFWLLAFSMFIFLSLAIVKRYSELLVTLQNNMKEPAGRGYSIDDLPVLMALGASAGLCSVLILALYINSPETVAIYPNTHWLWLLPPLMLYWNSRIWMKAHRGQVDDDPVIFALRDWQSLSVMFATASIFIAALYL